MSLVGSTTDGLPCSDHVHGELQVHGDDKPPDEFCLPAPGHQTQQRDSKRRLGQSQGERLEIVMGSSDSDLGQAAWDQKYHHQPRQAGRGQEKKGPPGEENPVVRLESDTDFSKSAVASESHEDGRHEKLL